MLLKLPICIYLKVATFSIWFYMNNASQKGQCVISSTDFNGATQIFTNGGSSSASLPTPPPQYLLPLFHWLLHWLQLDQSWSKVLLDGSKYIRVWPSAGKSHSWRWKIMHSVGHVTILRWTCDQNMPSNTHLWCDPSPSFLSYSSSRIHTMGP